MARIVIKSVQSWLKGGEWYATSWKATLSPNPDSTDGVIEESVKDTLNKTSWSPMLPVIGGNEGEYYFDLDEFYIHYKLHYRNVLLGANYDGELKEGTPIYGEDETIWITSPKLSQKDYDTVITRNGEPIVSTTSKEINLEEGDRSWVIKNVEIL